MTADQTITLNQNLAECLRSTNDLGSTTVTNICTGAQSVVPWGSADWALCVGLSSVAAIVILMVLGMVLTVLRDMFWGY